METVPIASLSQQVGRLTEGRPPGQEGPTSYRHPSSEGSRLKALPLALPPAPPLSALPWGIPRQGRGPEEAEEVAGREGGSPSDSTASWGQCRGGGGAFTSVLFILDFVSHRFSFHFWKDMGLMLKQGQIRQSQKEEGIGRKMEAEKQ